MTMIVRDTSHLKVQSDPSQFGCQMNHFKPKRGNYVPSLSTSRNHQLSNSENGS